MPYPSGACTTCRSRRIKCDQTRPTCQRCQRSSRQCVFNQDPGHLLFVNENFHASAGVPRRRGGATAARMKLSPRARAYCLSPPTRLCGSAESSFPNGATELNEAHHEASPYACLPGSFEDEAVNAFLMAHTHTEEDRQPALWSILYRRCEELQCPRSDSIVNAALSAVSLAYLAKIRSCPNAMGVAHSRYGHALRKIRAATSCQTWAATDEALCSVVLLSHYENIIGSFSAETLFSDSFRHLDGARSMLFLRKPGNGSRNSLDKHIRRLIVRQAAYRSVPIPSWLQDGRLFGEVPPYLGLDQCLVEVANLRHRTIGLLHLLKDPSYFQVSTTRRKLHMLIRQGILVTQRLSSWASSLPIEESYEVVSLVDALLAPAEHNHSPLSYGKDMHSYKCLNSASMWNQYRSALIIAQGCISRLLLHLEDCSEHDYPRYFDVLQAIHSLANDICASVPFHFQDLTSKDLKSPYRKVQFGASRASLLTYPLIIVNSISVISEDQRQWIKSILLLVSQLTGNGVSRQVAKLDIAGIHRSLAFES